MSSGNQPFNRAQEVITKLPLAVLVEDENRNISVANKYFCTLFQLPLTPEQLKGMNCEGLADQAKSSFKDPDSFVAFIEEAISTRAPILDEELQLSNGRYVSASYEPYFKEKEFAGHIWIYQDITSRKLAENELLITIQKERQLNEMQARFVGMVSHEIRTPMAGILSSVELLEMLADNIQQTEFRAKFTKHFDRIKSQIQRVTELTNDVLTLGKLEARKIDYHPEEVNVLSLVKEIIEQNFSPALIKRKIKIEADGVQRTSKLDIGLFKHIVINLLGNALKYSANRPDPILKITYQGQHIQIEITDFGIGIPQQEQKEIFLAFSRASNAHNIEGTGLGLALVKHFVEMHKGRITFKSSENQGSTFKVTFPG
jgi:signal transduction histidine kinase